MKIPEVHTDVHDKSNFTNIKKCVRNLFEFRRIFVYRKITVVTRAKPLLDYTCPCPITIFEEGVGASEII